MKKKKEEKEKQNKKKEKKTKFFPQLKKIIKIYEYES